MKKKRFQVFLENGQRLVQESESTGEIVPCSWAGVKESSRPDRFCSCFRGRSKVFVLADRRLTRPKYIYGANKYMGVTNIWDKQIYGTNKYLSLWPSGIGSRLERNRL